MQIYIITTCSLGTWIIQNTGMKNSDVIQKKKTVNIIYSLQNIRIRKLPLKLQSRAARAWDRCRVHQSLWSSWPDLENIESSCLYCRNPAMSIHSNDYEFEPRGIWRSAPPVAERQTLSSRLRMRFLRRSLSLLPSVQLHRNSKGHSIYKQLYKERWNRERERVDDWCLLLGVD